MHGWGRRLGSALLVALLAALCVRLGYWQLDRWHQRRAANAVVTANARRPPVPVDTLLSPGTPLDRGMQWRRVTATGQYDAIHELLARDRPADGRLGYHVLTPLVTPSGSALLVDRGWVPFGATATSAPDVPPPPPGRVTVTGRIRASEPPGARGSRSDRAPAGQVIRIDLATIGGQLPYPLYGGWVELTAQRPAASGPLPQPPPPPEVSDGPHLAYAVQWFLFAGIAVVGGGYLTWADAGSRRRRPRAVTGSGDEREPARTG